MIPVESEPTAQVWRKDWSTNRTASLLRPGDFSGLRHYSFVHLYLGLTSCHCDFVRGAGTGGLGLAIEGPSEAKMSCKDNKDGSCSVEYIPFTPGEYDVNITFGGLPIPGTEMPPIIQIQYRHVGSFLLSHYMCCREPVSSPSTRAGRSQ